MVSEVSYGTPFTEMGLNCQPSAAVGESLGDGLTSYGGIVQAACGGCYPSDAESLVNNTDLEAITESSIV